jgi:hypothetical protein
VWSAAFQADAVPGLLEAVAEAELVWFVQAASALVSPEQEQEQGARAVPQVFFAQVFALQAFFAPILAAQAADSPRAVLVLSAAAVFQAGLLPWLAGATVERFALSRPAFQSRRFV